MISRHSFPLFFFLRNYLLAGIILQVAVSCNSVVRPEEERDLSRPDMLYRDYQATGDEESDEVTVRLQFRYGGPEGNALLLDTPAQVSFDGHRLLPDSSKMGGIYYEIHFAAADFEGLHEIIFDEGSGHLYKDTFHFPFFSLSADIPPSVSRANGLALALKGLNEKETLHIMLTDTSFYGKGIDRIDTISNGELRFSSQDLLALKNGPVHLAFYREQERRLNQTGRQGGRLYLSYNVNREFDLVD